MSEEAAYVPLYITRNLSHYSYVRMRACGSLSYALRFLETEIRDYITLMVEKELNDTNQYRAQINKILYALEREDIRKNITDMVYRDELEAAVKYLQLPLLELQPNHFDNIKLRNATKIEHKISTIYTCHNCKGKRIRTSSVQIRSLDEGASTSFTCLDCGHMWVRS